MDFFFTKAGMILFIEAIDFYGAKRDSTDAPKSKWYKFDGESSLRVYTDHATGVQYIKSGLFGNLRVRLNEDGSPYTSE